MLTPFQILTGFIYVCATVLAIYFGASIGEDGLAGFVRIMTPILALTWMMGGGRLWWLLLFFGLGLGGEFYFGFKILSYEAGLAAGVVALAPVILLSHARPHAHRKPLPLLLWLFLAYLMVHCFISLARFGGHSLIGIGSIMRAYFNPAWGLIFLILFHRYGSSRHLKWALYALEAASFLRGAMGAAVFFWPGFLYLPGINFVLPGSTPGSTADLRWAGLGLCQVAVALLFDRRAPFLKGVHLLMVGFGLACLLLGGGRAALLSSIFLIVFASLYSRRRKISLAFLTAVVAGLVALNMNPQAIDSLPPIIQRSASILVIKQGQTWSQRAEESSNEYHRLLYQIGFKRWKASVPSILFGTGVKAYNWEIYHESNWEVLGTLVIDEAANTGHYETALWDILALMGLVAMLFDLALIFYFCRKVAQLSAVASKDRFGRVFSFVAYGFAAQWLFICALQGSPPSFEIMMAGLAWIYLQDRAHEQAEEPVDRERLPKPPFVQDTAALHDEKS